MIEIINEKIFYLAKSTSLNEFCFFTEVPTLLLFRSAQTVWTNAEFVCKLYEVDKIFGCLDIPYGRCWMIKVISFVDGSTKIEVMDKDVEFKKKVV